MVAAVAVVNEKLACDKREKTLLSIDGKIAEVQAKLTASAATPDTSNQALRLPKEFRFNTEQVEIFRQGNDIAMHNPPVVRARFEPLNADALAMSVITLGELQHGAEKSQTRAKALVAMQQLESAIQVRCH